MTGPVVSFRLGLWPPLVTVNNSSHARKAYFMRPIGLFFHQQCQLLKVSTFPGTCCHLPPRSSMRRKQERALDFSESQ
jgi:hypothetical protein